MIMILCASPSRRCSRQLVTSAHRTYRFSRRVDCLRRCQLSDRGRPDHLPKRHLIGSSIPSARTAGDVAQTVSTGLGRVQRGVPVIGLPSARSRSQPRTQPTAARPGAARPRHPVRWSLAIRHPRVCLCDPHETTGTQDATIPRANLSRRSGPTGGSGYHGTHAMRDAS